MIQSNLRIVKRAL